jgi:hypothetical protein
MGAKRGAERELVLCTFILGRDAVGNPQELTFLRYAHAAAISACALISQTAKTRAGRRQELPGRSKGIGQNLILVGLSGAFQSASGRQSEKTGEVSVCRNQVVRVVAS